MKRIRTYLSQVNTWTAIAILALTGWLLDSLFWYLETHPLTLAGFITFLGHSWYALLLLGAIFIILRLHRPSELLSLTIYDERGLPLHHQGNFRLEEAVLDPILASFQGATQTAGLHQLKLPAGPVIYFFKQGALTLVACFSGPPPQRQLDEGLRLIAQQEVPGEDLLGDLPLDVAALAIKLLKAAVERELLVQLWTKRRTAMTAADWASQVGYDELEVTGALENLEGLALVQRQCAGDLTFYRLTNDAVLLRRLEEFIAWRGDWLFRAHRVEELVGSGS
ncbi:MAG: hypothetical protein BroJett011_13630 [Chloroflexota bacterium]|nr:MAG: hypothetical protein BroJett011_13630 [Chloroflexota bacterium]